MDRFHAMLDHARQRHGTLADLLPAVFEERPDDKRTLSRDGK